MKETEITEQRNIPNVFYVTFNSGVSNLGIFLRGAWKKWRNGPGEWEGQDRAMEE